MFLYIQKPLLLPRSRTIRSAHGLNIGSNSNYRFMKELKTEAILLRLTKDEKDILARRAEEHGKTVSSFIRSTCIYGKFASKTDVQTVLELRKIGSNINHLVKYVHMLPVDENVAYSLKRIHEYMDELDIIKKKIL